MKQKPTLRDELNSGEKSLSHKDYDTGDEGDVHLLMVDGLPFAIIPISERASALFNRWGWEEESEEGIVCAGIEPPEDPTYLINSFPSNWTMSTGKPKEGAHCLQVVPLPQPLVVLH